MTYLLETKNLSKQFKKQSAVKNLNLKVRENAIYGLLGSNGAGKSTSLKMIVGILKPTSGEIYFNNHPWTRKDLRSMGSLIESPALYANLSAVENLKLHAKLLDLDSQRIDEVLAIVGLKHIGKKHAAQFSMGMKQRLGIAIALLNHPALLILDEPTNSLDPIGIQELRALIQSFPSQGVTVILSSHILSEVQLIADDIGIISNGVLSYQQENYPNEDLEFLFMEIVRKNRGDVMV